MIEKPLLAGNAPEDLSTIAYPVIASPKLDGIRCLIRNGEAVSRTFKPIPNRYIREKLAGLPDGVDGELVLRDMTAPFRDVTSAVMSREGEPDFVFAVFDFCVDPQRPFTERLANLTEVVLDVGADWIEAVPHERVEDLEQLVSLVDRYCEADFEGAMVRDPQGPYKFGRSSTKQGILLKIKAWADDEATVIDLVERMHNANEATRNAVGKIERSTAKGGKVPLGTMGALVCRFEDGTEFEVGTGFTDEERQAIWDEHAGGAGTIVGRVAKVKHQPPPGGRPDGVAPRFPVFLGWRLD